MSKESNVTGAGAPNPVEQVVSRAVRDNLERVQRASDELHQAIADVVAACSSAKPTNALPPMLRAQTSAASLTAMLEVLSRFVATTLQPGSRFEGEIARLAGSVAVGEVASEPAHAHVEPAHVEAPVAKPSKSSPAAHKPEPAPPVVD